AGGASLTITSQFVGQKAGSAVCYENTLFNDALVGRINAIVGNIIVRQSVAPCTRCRAGYRQLAQNGPHTIVVSSDDGYDGAPETPSSSSHPPGWCSTDAERPPNCPTFEDCRHAPNHRILAPHERPVSCDPARNRRA
ncbi:hypothetical protein RIM93_32925, partial [Pseudomonas aeruginosa]|nr:hypothetical protein [Pseudomonas aeruginosa]